MLIVSMVKLFDTNFQLSLLKDVLTSILLFLVLPTILHFTLFLYIKTTIEIKIDILSIIISHPSFITLNLFPTYHLLTNIS